MSSEKYQNYVNELEENIEMRRSGAFDLGWIDRDLEIFCRLFAKVMDDLVPILKSIERKMK